MTARIHHAYLQLLPVLALLGFAFLYFVTHTTVYVSPFGNDGNPGTRQRPVQHIAVAYSRILVGGTIRLLPGIYREAVMFPPKKPWQTRVTLQGVTEKGAYPVLTGMEPVSGMAWARCTADLCPDIPAAARASVFVGIWDAPVTPTILTEKLQNGEIRQLVLARSPNENITDPDKYHEHWWSADAENGNPKTLADTQHLRGLFSADSRATAFIMDGKDRCGTYLYERGVVAGNPDSGAVAFNEPVGALTYGLQENGLGKYTKYYLEDNPGFLDVPGEWFFDSANRRLYVWPLEESAPPMQGVEIGVRTAGIRIERSDVSITGITVEGINDWKDNGKFDSGAVVIGSGEHEAISGILLTHLTIRNAGNGISVRPPDSTTVQNVAVRNADISKIAKDAIVFDGKQVAPTNITGVEVADSVIHDAGRRYNEPAVYLIRVSGAVVAGNRIYNNNSYGILATGYQKQPGLMGHIRLSGNTVEHSCQNASYCSAIKIFGGRFTDTAVERNVLKDTVGWSYCDEQTEHVNGSGIGVFISNASGVTVTENTAVDNSFAAYLAYPRQFAATNNIFFRNTAEHSRIGLVLNSAEGEPDTDPAVHATRHNDTIIVGNKFIKNSIGMQLDPADPRKLFLGANTYTENGAAMQFRSDWLQSLHDIRTEFPFWEVP